jgi:CRP-like cAMP-binding protein
VALSAALEHLPYQNEHHNQIEKYGIQACLLQLMVALLCNLVQDEGGQGGHNRLGPTSTAFLIFVVFGSTLAYFGMTVHATVRGSLKTKGVVGKLARVMAKCCRIGQRKDRGGHHRGGGRSLSLARVVPTPQVGATGRNEQQQQHGQAHMYAAFKLQQQIRNAVSNTLKDKDHQAGRANMADLKKTKTMKQEIAALRLKKNIRQTLEHISKDGQTTDADRNLKKVEEIEKNHQKHRNSAMEKVKKRHTNRRSSLQLRVQARKKVKHSNALLKLDCFSTLAPASMSTIIDEMEFSSIRENNYAMCRQGDDADIFYIIVSGACQVTIDGKPIAVLGELDFFGESALFTDGQSRSKRGATVTTIIDEGENAVQVLALSRMKFNKLIASGDLNEDCVHKLKGVAEKRRQENKRNNGGGEKKKTPTTSRSSEAPSEAGEVKMEEGGASR